MLDPMRMRFEVAIGMEPTSGACPSCSALVFAPGWWCDECEACAFPTMLLDDDHEPEPDEPNGDDEPDADYS